MGGADAVEQPEPEHHADPTRIGEPAGRGLGGVVAHRDRIVVDRRLLVDPPVTGVGVHHGDRFLHHPRHAGGECGVDHRGRALPPDAMTVRPGRLPDERGGPRKGGREIDDRAAAVEVLGESVSIEQRHPNRGGAVGTQRGSGGIRARQRTHVVSRGDQCGHRVSPDGPRTAGDEYPHAGEYSGSRCGLSRLPGRTAPSCGSPVSPRLRQRVQILCGG